MKLLAALTCLSALGVGAAGDEVLSFRVRDESAPAEGTVQMKIRTTEGEPISGGRPAFSFDAAMFDAVSGIGMFAATGELAGAAVVNGNHVAISYVTTPPFTGEYPVMTVALRIRPDASVGSRSSFTLDPSSLWNLNGALVLARVSPGTVTVSGSVAISDVFPVDDSLPAGTLVTVRGVGFNSRSRLRLASFLVATRFVSSTEMQATLREPANLTGAEVRVDNPDLSRSIYHAYLRGIPAATSGRALLSTTQPIFSGTKRSVATVGPLPAMSGAQYAAFALQNPNLNTANVTLGLYAADGTLLHSAVRSLAKGYRLTLELSELFGGVVPPPGASVRVTSSLPIHAFGLLCDDGAWTVTPQLPVEAGS